MFDQMVEGADKYVTKEGSTWMIFTEEKRWVVEFTKDNTLWFNYNLFKSELELVSKDCVEEKDLIKNWFESRFLGIKPVEDTIQNGVRHTVSTCKEYLQVVEDTIQNRVRRTSKRLQKPFRSVKDAIQNGVKHTELSKRDFFPEDILQNGVKHTFGVEFRTPSTVENTIQNGICDVKHSYDFEKIVVKDIIEDSYPHKHRVEGVIRNTNKDGI